MLLAAITLDIGLSQQTLSCEAWRMWTGRAQGYYGTHMEPIACVCDSDTCSTAEPVAGEASLIKIMLVDESGKKSDAGEIELAD